MSDKDKRVTIRLTADLDSAIRGKADRIGLATSEIVRQALEVFTWEYHRGETFDALDPATLEELEEGLENQLVKVRGLQRQAEIREGVILENLKMVKEDREKVARETAAKVGQRMRQAAQQVDIEAG